MNNELNNMDDLLDDGISKSLKQIGFTFPTTADDFSRIEEDIKNNKVALPERLQDPYRFLNKRSYKSSAEDMYIQEQGEYFQKLAQAARDGKEITEDIKKKMAEDKLQSGKKKNEG